MAIYLGKRLGYPKEADAAALGGAELYWGVFVVGGLVWIQCRKRACSRYAGNQRFCEHAFCGSGSGVLLGCCANGFRSGKPSALGAISGAVAGLVAITPAAGFVQPMSAM